MMNSDFHQKTPYTENPEMPTKNIVFLSSFGNKCGKSQSNKSKTSGKKVCNADKKNISDKNGKTFIVVKDNETAKSINNNKNCNMIVNTSAPKNTSENVIHSQKTCNADRKIPSESCRRETFLGIKDDVAVKPINNNENCNIDNTSASKNITENITQSVSNNIGFSSSFYVAHVLNPPVSLKSVEKFNNNLESTKIFADGNKIHHSSCFQDLEVINKGMVNTHVINNIKDPPVICTEENNEFDTCLQRTESCKVLAVSAQESQEDDQHGICAPEISYNNDVLIVHTKVKGSSSPANVNVISAQNTCLEFEISSRNEENKTNVLKDVINLNENTSSNIENCRNENEEIDLENDITILKTSKLKRKSFRRKKRISYCAFFSSSDSDCEVICDTDFDFQDVQLVKDSSIGKLCLDTSVDENNAFNMESKKCETKSGNSNKIQELSNLSSIEEYKAEDIESNEDVTVFKIEAKVCPSSDAVMSGSYERNIFSIDVNRSVCDQNECVVNYNHAKNTVGEAAGGAHCFDMQNESESKPKILKRMRQKPPNDQIQLDDFLPIKKSKITNSLKVVNVANSEEIIAIAENENQNFDCKPAEKEIKSKEKNMKEEMKYSQGTSCKNTIVVYAEIHPPPPFVNLSPYDPSSKENKKVNEIKCRELSVILTDVFQTDIIKEVVMSCDKELLISKAKTRLHPKSPLSDNSSNGQSTVIPKDTTNAGNNSNCFEGSPSSETSFKAEMKISEINTKLLLRNCTL